MIQVTYDKENRKLQVIGLAMEMDFHSPERQLYQYEKVNKISEMKRKVRNKLVGAYFLWVLILLRDVIC